jgi:gluconokinase
MFEGAAVVMGVTGCGKTSAGTALAEKLGIMFIEGDKLHPASNIAKMSAGIALTDEDRWPWLDRVGESLAGTKGAVASCSALKRVYRQRIADAARRPVRFVFLDGGRVLLERRIAARQNHFMPATLLDSQLATLEPPGPDEHAKRIDVAAPLRLVVEQAALWLAGDGTG